MTVAPLIWLLVFVFIVAMIYACVKWIGVTIEPHLERIMIGLVAVIVVVVLIFWLLGLLGWSPQLEPFRAR